VPIVRGLIRGSICISTMEEYFIHNGENAKMWFWIGLGTRDKSNDEW
jgi:hypothetical protein